MKPWMTESARGLLTNIEIREEWDVLPILADALEEGGYEDGPAMLAMRSDNPSIQDKRWLRRIVEGLVTFTAVDEAIATMSELAREIPPVPYDSRSYDEDGERLDEDEDYNPSDYGYDFEWLMGVCKDWVKSQEEYCFGENNDNSEEQMKKMWDCYEILIGVRAERESYGQDISYEATPFRCAC